MESVVRVFAGIAPGNVHNAGSQVDDNGVDCFFPVQRVTILIYMIAILAAVDIELGKLIWSRWIAWSDFTVCC